MLTSILKTTASFLVILQVGKGVPSHETHQCLTYYDSHNIENVYVDVGKRGPCGKDQIFLPIPDDFNTTLLRGGALGSASAFRAGELNVRDKLNHTNLSNDRKSSDNSDCQKGYCMWNNQQHPCHGLPANQRYSNETKLCHTLGFQNYCPNNQIFYAQLDTGLDTLYGVCDCSTVKQLWFDSNDGNCYAPFSQGSCLDSQWLIINQATGRVECEPAPCPNDGKHMYWTTGFQKCFLLGEQGPCDPLYSQTLRLEMGVVRCLSPPNYFNVPQAGSGVIFSLTGKRESPFSTGRTCRKEGSRQSQAPSCPQVSRNVNPNPCGLGRYSETLKRCDRTRTVYSN